MSSAYTIPPPVYLQPSSTSTSLYSVQASEPHYLESQPGSSSSGTSIQGFHQGYPNPQPQYLTSEATQQPNGAKFASSQASPNSGAGSAAGSASGSRRTPTPGEEVEMNNDGDKPDGDDDPATYDPLRVKHRRRTSSQQLKILEHHFGRNPKPDVNVRKVLSEQLEMTPREIQVWFQNRRAKIKKLREKAMKDGTDPALVDGSARVHSEDATKGEQQYWANSDGQNAQKHGPYYESYAANASDYAHQQEYGFDSRAHYASNSNSSQSPPGGYYDPSVLPPTTSGAMYGAALPAHASTNMYGQPTGRGGYPTPTSLRNQSPLDALPAGLTDGVTEQGYVTSQAPQRFTLPAYDGAGTQNGYHSAAEAHNSLPYATPPIDPQLTHVYREYDYISRRDDDEGSELHEDMADTYSIASHHHPSTSSFNLPLDPQLANGSRIAERRSSLQALDQTFDATLNLANGSNANVVTSPTRIGGIAAPQWPVGASSRTAYAAPAFAPTTVPATEYVYGAWPQTTPAVNYFPTVDLGAFGRRGSLHSIPE